MLRSSVRSHDTDGGGVVRIRMRLPVVDDTGELEAALSCLCRTAGVEAAEGGEALLFYSGDHSKGMVDTEWGTVLFSLDSALMTAVALGEEALWDYDFTANTLSPVVDGDGAGIGGGTSVSGGALEYVLPRPWMRPVPSPAAVEAIVVGAVEDEAIAAECARDLDHGKACYRASGLDDVWRIGAALIGRGLVPPSIRFEDDQGRGGDWTGDWTVRLVFGAGSDAERTVPVRSGSVHEFEQWDYRVDGRPRASVLSATGGGLVWMGEGVAATEGDESFSNALLGLFERFCEANDANDEQGIGQKGRVPCD